MRTTLKRLAASSGAVVALTAGMAVLTPSTASAAPCGLSGYYSGDRYHYTIRNCHGYAVYRELNIVQGFDDAPCHFILQFSQVSGSHQLAPWEYVDGIKSC